MHFTPFQRILYCDFRLVVHILGTSSRGYCKAQTRGAAAAALCRAAAPQRSTALPRVLASRRSESPATAAPHRLPRPPSATGNCRAEPPASCRATYSLPAPGCRPFEIKPGWRVALIAPSSEPSCWRSLKCEDSCGRGEPAASDARQWPEVYDSCHTFLHVAREKRAIITCPCVF